MDSSSPSYMQCLSCPHERHALEHVSVPEGATISTTTSVARLGDGSVRVDYQALHQFVQKNTPFVSPSDTGAVITTSKLGGFAGQVTVNVATNGRNVNVFLFHNGSVKCTGVDHPRTGVRALHALLEICKAAGVLKCQDPTSCKVERYRTVNINSAFHLNYEVDRTALFKLLKLDYNLLSLYDPTQYPGVNTKYFYNVFNRIRDGRCHCCDDNEDSNRTHCVSRKGDGNSRYACRRITVTVFRSGIIIFTGARNYSQLRDAFECITGICSRHMDSIRMMEFNLVPDADWQLKN